MKKIIKLTESDLHRIVKRCINESLNELAPETYYSLFKKRRAQANATNDDAERSKLMKKAKEGEAAAFKAWNKKYGNYKRNGECLSERWMDYGIDENPNYCKDGDYKMFDDISVTDRYRDKYGMEHERYAPLIRQCERQPDGSTHFTVYNPINDKVRFTVKPHTELFDLTPRRNYSKGGYASKMNGFPEHLQAAKRMFSDDPSKFYVKGKGHQGY